MRTDKFNLAFKAVAGEPVKKCMIKVLFPFRNDFILFNVSNRAKDNTVNLDYWDESDNLGDTLAPIITNYMLSLENIDPDKKVSGKKHLYTVGSVLTAGIQDATVWGSGVLNSKLSYRLKGRNLDIRSVRGPSTRAVLMDYGFNVPEVYGDPAILMPEIYQPRHNEKKYKFGLILHKDDVRDQTDDIKQININTADYKSFIDEICSVEIVISSSLHGIILAESYGIPAILLKPQKDIIKYFDYYASTGRLEFPIADTLNEAMSMTPSRIPQLDALRERIKKVFPYDIFE